MNELAEDHGIQRKGFIALVSILLQESINVHIVPYMPVVIHANCPLALYSGITMTLI